MIDEATERIIEVLILYTKDLPAGKTGNIIKTAVFNHVYEYKTEDFESFPAAVVTYVGSESEIFTTTQAKFTHTWNIEIWQSFSDTSTQIDQKQAQSFMDVIIGDLSTRITKDSVLQGLFSILHPIQIEDRQVVTGGQGNYLKQNIYVIGDVLKTDR